MMKKIPQDPMICFSVVNTKLRDQYSSLDELCEDYEIEKEKLEAILQSAGFQYDEKKNQFC